LSVPPTMGSHPSRAKKCLCISLFSIVDFLLTPCSP
jgi:hypothetical protein